MRAYWIAVRLGVVIVAALSACALLGAASGGAAGIDTGKNRPPAKLTSDFQSIWMTEWSACWHLPLGAISNTLHIPVRAGMTPQQAANKLSKRAVFLLYNTAPETAVGADGCRNGILYRYYHPPAVKVAN